MIGGSNFIEWGAEFLCARGLRNEVDLYAVDFDVALGDTGGPQRIVAAGAEVMRVAAERTHRARFYRKHHDVNVHIDLREYFQQRLLAIGPRPVMA